jgi:hypothetical protein
MLSIINIILFDVTIYTPNIYYNIAIYIILLCIIYRVYYVYIRLCEFIILHNNITWTLHIYNIS